MTMIELLRREGEWHFARGTREKAADALEEALLALIAWQAAYDWADQTKLMPAFAIAKKLGERALTRHGVSIATTSVELKRHQLTDPDFGDDIFHNRQPWIRHKRTAPLPEPPHE